MRQAALLVSLLLPHAALAVELQLPPEAVLAAEDTVPFAAMAFPEGPWSGGPPPTRAAEGALTRRAWRLPGGGTPDALLATIRTSLEQDGYSVLFTCADRACGGYDFRFTLDLLPAPAMFVDLGNYRYLLAEDAAGAVVSVVTSAGLGAGYVHLTEVVPGQPPAAAIPVDEAPAPTPPPPDSLATRLLADGHVVLDGLVFPSGSASLPDDRYESLADLAAFLAENPGASILLVGHTDAQGGLDANLALSRARAQAVRMRLIGAYGTDGARIRAEGAGYLAPVASNLTPDGQAANRRVEAVLLAAP